MAISAHHAFAQTGRGPHLKTFVLLCANVGLFGFLIWYIDKVTEPARSAKLHHCSVLANQVLSSEASLSDYMNTECKLAILAAADGR